MAVVNQLNLNVGTEQSPNFVLHDINDKRISTTAVTTATHLLTCNSGVTSIAPITAANLASVLGAEGYTAVTVAQDETIELPLVYGGTYMFSESQGYSFAIISVQYSAVSISANSGSWCAEGDTSKPYHVSKRDKANNTNGVTLLTNNTSSRYFLYKRIR